MSGLSSVASANKRNENIMALNGGVVIHAMYGSRRLNAIVIMAAMGNVWPVATAGCNGATQRNLQPGG